MYLEAFKGARFLLAVSMKLSCLLKIKAKGFNDGLHMPKGFFSCVAAELNLDQYF